MKKEKMTPVEDLNELINEINPPPHQAPTLERDAHGKFFGPASKITYPIGDSTGGTRYVYDEAKMVWVERS